MAANPISVVERRHAVQYDGTNSGDISALFSLETLSENAGVWTFESPPDSSVFVTNTNDWIVYAQNMALFKFSPGDFDVFYRCNAECDDLSVFSTGVQIRAMGVAPVPLLLASGSTTVAVQLQPAMPDASYTAYASKFAGVSLTDLNITSVSVVDEDTVNVGVQNVGLITLTGASVMVHAVN